MRDTCSFLQQGRELWIAAQSGLESGVDHTAVVRWFEEWARIRLTKNPTPAKRLLTNGLFEIFFSSL